jgi:hypothetical protein
MAISRTNFDRPEPSTIAAIRAAMEKQCQSLGCQPTSFGGHHIDCRSFSYRAAIARAYEGKLSDEDAIRWSS